MLLSFSSSLSSILVAASIYVTAICKMLAYLLTMGTAHWILSAKLRNAEKEKALHTPL